MQMSADNFSALTNRPSRANNHPLRFRWKKANRRQSAQEERPVESESLEMVSQRRKTEFRLNCRSFGWDEKACHIGTFKL